MLHLAIPESQRAELNHVLKGGNGTIDGRGRVQVTNSDHRVISDLSGWLLDGQVEWDTLADVERTSTCTILDPDGRAGLDSAAATESNVRIDRYLRMYRQIWLPHHEEWVSIPVFTGPISGVQRNGDTITVEGQGKESLAMQPLWRPMSWGKTTRRVQVIEDLMRYGAGEWAFHMPPGWSTPLGRTYSVPRVIGDEDYTVWAQAKKQAKALGGQLYYDARGILRLRNRHVRTVWSFDERQLEGKPTVTERTSDIVNVVVVTGGVPKGGKSPVTAMASLPTEHPWSFSTLGRRNVGRRYVEEVEDSSIVTQSEAGRVAKRRIREHATSAWEMQFNVLPVPMLEPGDLYRVDAYDVAQTSGLHKATISLTGDLMSAGSIRTYRPRRWWR